MPADAELNFVHAYKSEKSKTASLILKVNALAYTYIMKDKKIYVGCSRCKLYNEFKVNLCHKCCEYNHSTKSVRLMIPAPFALVNT